MRQKHDKKARKVSLMLQGFIAVEVQHTHESQSIRMATHMMENKIIKYSYSLITNIKI